MALKKSRKSGLLWGALAVLGIASFCHAQDSEKAKTFARQLQSGELDCSLDVLVTIPDAWNVTPDNLDKRFAVPGGVDVSRNPYFEWLTTTRDRAHFIKQPFGNLALDLTIVDGALPLEEAIIDFRGQKLNGITLSLYNRGDSGEIETSEFKRRFKVIGKHIGEQLGSRPFRRDANPTQGLLTEGWLWSSEEGYAALEYNPEAMQPGGKAEFLRLRLAPRGARGGLASSMGRRHAAVPLSDLPQNVEKNAAGDVWISGIPMVDQGPKGYCVVASCQRLFEYYGIPCDQHQIAQVADADAGRGTSTYAMAQALGKVDHRFKTRFKIVGMQTTSGRLREVDSRDMTIGDPVDLGDFESEIQDYIDDGIPLLWALELGRYPEEPAINLQQGGGHMRMIVGYNEQEQKVLFSDSWGAGHELKRMNLSDAFHATHGLFVMHPTTR